MEIGGVDHQGGVRREGEIAPQGSSWMGSSEEKKAAVDAEMGRMSKLPSNSSYALHRMRVLSKLRDLLSIRRSVSQDEELELLFASLSL